MEPLGSDDAPNAPESEDEAKRMYADADEALSAANQAVQEARRDIVTKLQAARRMAAGPYKEVLPEFTELQKALSTTQAELVKQKKIREEHGERIKAKLALAD